MTINVISDIHCGFDFKSNTVCWNRLAAKDSNNNIVKDKDVVEKYRKNAIEYMERYKESVIKDKEHLINYDPKLLTYTWYGWKYKCKSYDQCIDYINKIIKYLKTDNYLKAFNVANMCGAVEYFVNRVSTFYSPLDSVRRVLQRRYCDFIPEHLKPADYLIVAGDLGLDASYKKVYTELKERTKHLFKDVFFIKGNHDYWCFDDDPVYKYNINMQDRYFEKTIGDYLFLGCTLWAPVKRGTWQERCVVRGMNDYNYIPNFTTEKVNSLYNEESNWLRYKIQANPDKKVIVFTHHNPIEELIDDDYKHSEVNAAYAVLDHSCDDIKPLLWICGHSHSYKDITKNGVRYFRNPIGYREMYNYLPSECPTDHWYNSVIEI